MRRGGAGATPTRSGVALRPIGRTALATALLLSAGCAVALRPAEPGPQDRFWAALTASCGGAYAGGLTLEPPGDEMLTGTEALVVHFRGCTADTVRAAFHIEKEAEGRWDRSRTWVFIRSPAGLELRHDHRHEDGTPDTGTWYGGHTADPGSATRQEFVFTERRAADGSVLGWRVEIVPGERYTYGTVRGGEWTWRVDFDLRERIPPPPPAWGHEER
jgi:hypothetical protein